MRIVGKYTRVAFAVLTAMILVEVLFFRLTSSPSFYGSDFFALASVVLSIVPRFEIALLSILPLHLPFLLFSLTQKYSSWAIKRKVFYWGSAVLVNAAWLPIFGMHAVQSPLGIVLPIFCVGCTFLLARVIYRNLDKRAQRKMANKADSESHSQN